MNMPFKGTVSRDFLLLVFFMGQFRTQPQSIPLRPFRIFSKIRGDIRKSIIKIFLMEDFFHLPPVSTTPVVHLEPRISPRIFEKIRNGRDGILRCLGETDS